MAFLSLSPPSKRLRRALVAGLAAVAVLAVGRSVDAVSVVQTSGPSVQLEANKGTLLRLDRPATTVFVANPEIADVQVKSPSLIYLMGVKPGQTTLYAVDDQEQVLASIAITVSHSLGRLRQAVKSMHPGVNLDVASIEGSIVLDGVVPTATVSEDVRSLAASFVEKEEGVINRLSVSMPSQVNLRVRVAEVSRDINKQLGINWNALFNDGGFAFGLATNNPFNINVIEDVVVGSLRTKNWSLDAKIDALEDEGLISILAEPNLTAITGETASFLAGGEFPILVPQGEDKITVEFKKFGVSLEFTPTILDSGRISLHVRPEVSALSNEGAISVPIAGGQLQVPALKVRRAETTVELGSGQSFAIAGLLENNISHSLHKFPGLGDVPVLGALFRSDDFQRDESELVIMVTPYVVQPVANSAIALPTDGFAPPTDAQRLMYGKTQRTLPNLGRRQVVVPDGGRLIGGPGFILN
ncbi:MAG: type II and III secretion system protein family protein [Rhodospirillales bacterium]|nr:type II and III secretion system protein family protein [Rhodospirillales bacterium]